VRLGAFNIMTNEKKSPYDLGRDVGYSGGSLEKNPYNVYDENYSLWLDGHTDGEADMKHNLPDHGTYSPARSAYSIGSDAGYASAPYSSNPYVCGTLDYCDWEDGYGAGVLEREVFAEKPALNASTNAHDLGYDVGYDGGSPAQNPYDDSLVEHWAWKTGHDSGMLDRNCEVDVSNSPLAAAMISAHAANAVNVGSEEKKSLYDNEFRYTKDAVALSNATHSLLREIFSQYVKKGYSPREIAHLICGEITDLELNAVLDIRE
jgi:ribosome modulation factor